MIYAGLVLLAVGLADLVRRFVPARARWVTLGAGGVAIILFGALAAAPIAAVLAVAIAAAWVWVFPSGRDPRLSFWPAVALGLFAIAAVMAAPARAAAGIFGDRAALGPIGDVPFDLLVLGAGVGVVMLETGNEIVRAALSSERLPIDEVPVGEMAVPEASDSSGEPVPAASGAPATFRGGRLIGPLERVLVLMLTLALAYSLLAAMLAAKGIVRFPEISRDRASGARAEYFLVGSLVSWVVALSGAFLLWWAASVTGLR